LVEGVEGLEVEQFWAEVAVEGFAAGVLPRGSWPFHPARLESQDGPRGSLCTSTHQALRNEQCREGATSARWSPRLVPRMVPPEPPLMPVSSQRVGVPRGPAGVALSSTAPSHRCRSERAPRSARWSPQWRPRWRPQNRLSCWTFRARAPSAQRFGRHDQLECLFSIARVGVPRGPTGSLCTARAGVSTPRVVGSCCGCRSVMRASARASFLRLSGVLVDAAVSRWAPAVRLVGREGWTASGPAGRGWLAVVRLSCGAAVLWRAVGVSRSCCTVKRGGV
jgi:hypothetical protein